MDCKSFLDRHSEYHDGVLDAAAADQLRAHAERCPSCARYDAVVRRGTDLARALLPTIELSSDFESRMRHRLYQERDAVAHRRSGGARAGTVYAAACVVLAIAAAGLIDVARARTPIVDGQVVFAAAPPAMSSLASNAFVVQSAPALPSVASATAGEPVTPIEAEAKGHDPHVATPAGWPVYSRGDAAAAFPASHTTLVVRPAEFRPIVSRVPVTPILIRH